MSVLIVPERCVDCQVPLFLDIEALVLYCPKACGNEIYIGITEDDEDFDWNDSYGG